MPVFGLGDGLTEVNVRFVRHVEVVFDFLESCSHSLEMLELLRVFLSL